MNKCLRTWAEINLGALRHNYHALRERAPGSRFMGVVKANAYGHGAVEIARELNALGADFLGVAEVSEAAELTAAGISLPILVLGRTPPSAAGELIARGLTQTVTDIETARAYSRLAAESGKTLKIHIKLDTGMGRLGFGTHEHALRQAAEAAALSNLEPEGVFSHFAVSDEPEGEGYTLGQLRRFTEAADKIEAMSGVRFKIRHCANSGGVVNYPETCLDMVRPGIALYGAYADDPKGLNLRPVMSLKTRIMYIYDLAAGESVSYGRIYTAREPRRVAVIPVGYADGLHRVLSGKFDVLVNGRRAPQIGRICMDMCMVDITSAGPCALGDVVTVFGPGEGGEIPLRELAEAAGTVTYELVTSIALRAERVYVS